MTNINIVFAFLVGEKVMPTFKFEAMDASGQEIRDQIEAEDQAEAQALVRQMGYFVTKISMKKPTSPKIVTGRTKVQRGADLGVLRKVVPSEFLKWLNQRDWIYIGIIIVLVLILIFKQH